MIESIVNAAMDGEMDAHLTQESRDSGNRCNDKMQKRVQTLAGDITVSTPRDRDSSFDLQFLKKRETMLSEGMADRIIGLYALGTSTRNVMSHHPQSDIAYCHFLYITPSLDRVVASITYIKSVTELFRNVSVGIPPVPMM